MDYRVVPVETMTGRRILPWIETGAFQWKSSLTNPGDGQFPLYLRDARRPIAGNVADSLARWWGTTYVVETGPDTPRPGEILYAGVVVDDTFSAESGVLTVRTKELGEVLKRRTFWTLAEMQNAETRGFTGATMGDLIKQVFVWTCTRNALGVDRLPFDLPSIESGALRKQLFRYNFPTAQDVLDEIAAEGGPDWFLRPYWSGAVLRWRLEVGSPNLDAGQLRFPTAAGGRKSSVTGLTRAGSGLNQYTDMVAIGAGSEEDMRWSSAAGAGITGAPRLFGTVAEKQIDDLGALQRVARQSVTKARAGVRQFSYGLQLEQGGRVTPDMVKVGANVLLDHAGDERIPKDRYSEYVMEVTGSPSLALSVESQEV